MNKYYNLNKTCINAVNECYSGKEHSPKGAGYSAVAYDIGYEMKGVDGSIWSVQIKNGKKVWFRKSGMVQLVHEEPVQTSDVITTSSETVINHQNTDPNTVINKEPKAKNNYNLFYNYYKNVLKQKYNTDNVKISDKQLKEEIIEEWHRIKKNKNELNDIIGKLQ